MDDQNQIKHDATSYLGVNKLHIKKNIFRYTKNYFGWTIMIVCVLYTTLSMMSYVSTAYLSNVDNYLTIMKLSPPLRKTTPPDTPPGGEECPYPEFTRTPGAVDVISMSLYGQHPRYAVNLLINVAYRDANFPGWQLRIYHSDRDIYALSQDMLDVLSDTPGVQLILMNSTVLPPMTWRFLAADDPTVRNTMVRDADCRLSARDACAVKAWLSSGQMFSCIRDHPSHALYALSGGLWGVNNKKFAALIRRNGHDSLKMMMLRHTIGHEYMNDMDFLNVYMWPIVKNDTYCSDSVSCDKYESSHRFPVTRMSGYGHVGQVFDGLAMPRKGDLTVIRETAVNERCVPKRNDQ